MYHVVDFIKWALTHVKPESVPAGATLPIPFASCGKEPWHYLYGTVRVKTTQSRIEERWKNYYKRNWSREAYDNATAGMRPEDYATDCQGLLDAWLTYEQGEKTDINAHMNYTSWCTSKGKLAEIERPYVIGEALFIKNSSGKVSHVGWVCGFDIDGDPLIVEARGLAYGVVITRLDSRPWTDRGLMTKKFDYEEEQMEQTITPTVFEYTSPIKRGDEYRAMQRALNYAGYTDADGNELAEDGKWGQKSQAAFDKMIAAHSETEVMPIMLKSTDGRTIALYISDDDVEDIS